MKRTDDRAKAKTVRKDSNDSYMLPEYVWEDIKSGIKDIFDGQQIEKAQFCMLYSHIFNLNYFENIRAKYALDTLIGSHDLYNFVTQVLTEYIEEVCKVRIRRSRNLIETWFRILIEK